MVFAGTSSESQQPSSARATIRVRESVETALARNLVLARIAEGVTQKELASASEVSRATIAQLETGVSDPRVSTVTDLARALGLPTAFLLLSVEEIAALIRLVDEIRAHPIEVPPEQAARIRELLQTGLLRDRNRAARLGAELVGGNVTSPAAAALSAIFATIAPKEGPVVAAALGRLVDGTTPDTADESSARD